VPHCLALADELAGGWGLRLAQAWPKGGTSVVVACESVGGELLALKLTPDPGIARHNHPSEPARPRRLHIRPDPATA
jgi:hypothetical protein